MLTQVILDAYTTSCVVRNLGRTTTWLVLHEVADHLLAVAARAPVADVYPAGLARGGGLPDELVKREVVHHPGKPFAARLGVRDEDVGSAAAGVVRVFHAPDGGVEIIGMFLIILNVIFDVLLLIPVDDWESPMWGRVMRNS